VTAKVGDKRGKYHHGDLRRALLDAALELVNELGPSGITLREAARRAGVTHAAPYRHFADKGALLAAVAEQGFVQLLAAIDGAIVAVPRNVWGGDGRQERLSGIAEGGPGGV